MLLQSGHPDFDVFDIDMIGTQKIMTDVFYGRFKVELYLFDDFMFPALICGIQLCNFIHQKLALR